MKNKHKLTKLEKDPLKDFSKPDPKVKESKEIKIRTKEENKLFFKNMRSVKK